ncbi:DNA starvation/stationary phase protection protein [Bryobacterales bacterium F-183]|nr:DNA starvation/stationary phase protection protein [Bryobacterales bacterium F-183]
MAKSKSVASTHIALPPDTRKKMADLLNGLLASTLDLHSHAKQAHWNIRGPHFLTLHELFDKLAEQTVEHGDEIAERAGQLGFAVSGTLRQGASASKLNEYDLQIASGEDHVRRLSQSLGEYEKLLLDGIEDAEEAEDPVTQDILTRICGEIDKSMWMIESHIVVVSPEAETLTNNNKKAAASQSAA